MEYIYFDQAASSFPKPEGVGKAMIEAISEYGANPGRGGHQLSKRAESIIYTTRKKLATMFAEDDPANVIFFPNATYALNQAILGVDFQEGDHIISSHYEHNSVRRPLEVLVKERKISVTYIEPNETGSISAEQVQQHIQENTKAIIVSHGSNVTGAITPLQEISDIIKEKQLLFIVDASQTAGTLPISMKELAIDLLAFPGHKGLFGPQGTGVLIANKKVQLKPLVYGGTGSYSESVEQPEKRPEKYESGTLNTPGIAGLLAGIEWIEAKGITAIYKREWELTQYALDRLQRIEGIHVLGPNVNVERLAVIPLYIEGLDVHEAATILDEHYQIGVRAGLHCSPLTHQMMKTIETGTIRVSFSYFNTKEEIDRLVDALTEIKAYF